jgi:hypothetical protein
VHVRQSIIIVIIIAVMESDVEMTRNELREHE